ncbi:hypothetical protein BXT86_05115 [candidate division WOR-3 bacterium 4484_100]|uniref:PorV/PorQ family protein n=1 Tax=candidate division WOR-3 bacterium 4484_100 TaxID=1936077 RepID=A0A1V4QEB5_UNCW3|nr:MAG: hypothetical protein BXT86_05115 [candidate division WOR-3 bacterium 4484_100]
MGAVVYFLFVNAGVTSLLMPPSPIGVNAGFSLARGDEALFYNPANFEVGSEYQVQCYYNQYFLSMNGVSFSVSRRIGRLNLGLGFVNFDYGDIEWHPPYPTEDSLTTYSANDFSMFLGCAVRFSRLGRVGVNLKYISENIYIYSDYGLALDLTFAYNNARSGVSFGISNFGTRLLINNDRVNLPARISLGGYYKFKDYLGGVDVFYLVNNGKFEFNTTLGASFYKIIELYLGINYREEFYPGFGFSIRSDYLKIKYGGSFFPMGLGMVNTIGIGFSF